MQAQFDSFRTFDFQQANVHLWVFKKSSSARKYITHYVRTEPQLVNLIKELVFKEINRITEFSAYSYLAQSNENSCLTAEVDETDFSFLKIQVDRPEPEHEVSGMKDLKGAVYQDQQAAIKNESINLPKKLRKNKKIDMTLLVHPDWLKGAVGKDEQGLLGGTATSDIDSTIRWNEVRAKALRLVEVRGDLPEEITCPETSVTFNTSQGTIPKQSNFTCQEATCGQQQDVLTAIKGSGATGAMAAYTLQCYSPSRAEQAIPYNGRYFKTISVEDIKRQNVALQEWEARKEADLKNYWPRSELPFGHMTHQRQNLPEHGYTHWHNMFNSRQLLVHALILKAINSAYEFKDSSREIVIGAFQQFLAYENLFCFWHKSHDHFAPHLSNNNYHSKNTSIEVGVFSSVGYGPWRSAKLPTFDALEWKKKPWEIVPNCLLIQKNSDFENLVSGKSEKVLPNDPVSSGSQITCGSSTDLNQYEAETFDLVITDPPFGGLLHYSELSDFFYVWLRLVLKDSYPDYFTGEYTPKTLEAVANKARHPDDPDAFYKRILTQCWREANRLLKAGGILSFTFHHSEDAPWVDVLESLFDAGFYLEATYPIRSDETKGQGEFGSKTIEYDIIHVCRKRTEQPSRISWARLRRQILSDVRQLQNILEHHQNEGLPKADIQVIKRGKALEYFSRHYGQVYIEEGREFTVKEALAGINQILDDQDESEAGTTPVNCEPITRQFLRIFAGKLEVPRDQMQKFLRGTGIGPSDFVSRGWCEEKKKVFHWLSPLSFAQANADKVKSLKDMEQAMLLVGACYIDSGIQVKKLLNEDFKPHPALGELLNWLINKGGSIELKNAATIAGQLYNNWAAQNPTVIQKQLSLFDLE